MKKRPLGRTGLMVSEYCLGTMTWGTQTLEPEAHAQIDMALDHGIDFVDTAEIYPVTPIRKETVGLTEQILGNWIARTGRRDDFVLATKVTGKNSGTVRDGAGFSGENVRAACEGSLKRLQTDVIDLYQLHWPNRGSYHFRQNWGFDPSGQDRAEITANMVEVLETLDALVKEGKIRHAGLSNETAWGTMQWLALAAQHDLPRMQTVQNEYSLLYRMHDTDMSEVSVHEGVTLLAYSPLGTGLLTGKYAGDVKPEGSRRTVHASLHGRITPRVWGAVSAYLGIAQDFGLDPVHMAMAFTLSRPFPTIPIFGATRLDQLERILQGADVTLGNDVLRAIAAAHKDHPMPY